jgi:hypothetical protein
LQGAQNDFPAPLSFVCVDVRVGSYGGIEQVY